MDGAAVAPSPRAFGGTPLLTPSHSATSFPALVPSMGGLVFAASSTQNAPGSMTIEPALEIACGEPALAVEWSPFRETSDLIAFGGETKITLANVLVDNTDGRRPALTYRALVDMHHGTRLHSLAWAPLSQDGMSSLRLCAAGADFKLRLFEATVIGDARAQVQSFEGHTNYVNACAFSHSMENTLLSTGDDRSCRLWDTRTQGETGSMQLNTPGMAVTCHPSDPWKVMVAEKGGTVRFYDVRVLQPLFSMLASAQPLMDADWCSADEGLVGGIAGGLWQMWRLPYSGKVPESGLAHAEGGRHFRWSRSNPSLFATASSGAGIKIHSANRIGVPAFGAVKGLVGGLSWHAALPLCATGGERSVRLWAADL